MVAVVFLLKAFVRLMRDERNFDVEIKIDFTRREEFMYDQT